MLRNSAVGKIWVVRWGAVLHECSFWTWVFAGVVLEVLSFQATFCCKGLGRGVGIVCGFGVLLMIAAGGRWRG